jgi:hypothetical protein
VTGKSEECIAVTAFKQVEKDLFDLDREPFWLTPADDSSLWTAG